MQKKSKKILFKRKLPLIAAVGLILTFVVILNFISENKAEAVSPPNTPNTLQQYTQASTTYGLPVRLIIPRIKVNSTIEHVGITNLGAMEVPMNITNVAWFQTGPRPGEIGSAVIDGHYGWKNNKPAAFDNLNKLHSGDKIYVEDNTGKNISFIVREIRIYDMKANTQDVFISNDGKSHLNLITCAGIWNKIDKSYSNRIIVFADKIN